MATQQPELDWNRILETAGPYPLEAFNFVREGLSYTVERIHGRLGEGVGAPSAIEENLLELPVSGRHVSGQQLCLGLREFAIAQFGMLAPLVLERWHVRRTDDFGRIVFAMIDHGLMSKTADDSLDDFRAVYDFDDAFARDALADRIGRR